MRGDAAARARAVRRAARTALAGLVAALALAVGSPAHAAATPDDPDERLFTVDELAARLEQDPVLVQQVLGNGDADGAEERIREAIADADVPIYVALVADPGGLADRFPSQDLSTKLHKRLGDGYYIVQVSESILMIDGWGVPDPTSLSLARNDATEVARVANDHLEEGRPRVTPPADAQIAAELATGGEPFEIDPDRAVEITKLPGNVAPPAYSVLDDDPDPSTPGSRAVVATVVGVGALLVGLRLLLWLTAPKRRRPTRTVARTTRELELAPLVARANRETTRLSREVADAPTGPNADAAVGFLGAAEAVLRDLETLAEPEDRQYGVQLRDAVGALVLAQSGQFELGRAKRKTDPGRYRPCFFDPLHGRAESTVEVPGRTAVEVPACRRCAAAARDGGQPDALVFGSPARRRPRPYYEERTVWARTGYGALDGELWSTVLDERAGASR
ncbi:hypothetical protein [Mumia sp. DW29H23]|uniref:hypothetical protein n=1 Tax=Mumia sp. DW29H23 TaxID=3421241 RepID=UPI003D68B930